MTDNLAIVDVKRRGDITLGRVFRELDISNAATLCAELSDLVDTGSAGLVVDLGSLGFIDAAGVRELAGLAAPLGADGGDMRIVAPVGTAVRRALELVGTPAAIETDVRAALVALQGW